MSSSGKEQVLLKKWRALPAHKQQQVMDFAVFLGKQTAGKPPRKSLEGLWADLHIHVTQKDLNGARKEMWRSFPRDIEP